MITQQKWGKIRRYCENILDCISFLPELSGLEQRQLEKDKQTIGRIIRRVTIATELEGRRVVCVAGLQGSGKTSMLRRLLDLDEQLLPSTSGRGERLPILIFRGSVPAPTASRTFLQEDLESGNWRMVEETLENADDLKEFAANGADAYTMMLTLCIPQDTFPTALGDISFLLLPGFEGAEDEHEALIDYSVRCGGTCIYVVNKDLNASIDNRVQLEKLNEIFADRKPIYVMSFSESTENNNAEFRETLTQENAVQEPDRIIAEDIYDSEEKNLAWKAELINALVKYAVVSAPIGDAQQKYMRDQLASDLKDMDTIIKRYSNKIKLIGSLQDDKYLDALREGFQNQKRTVRRAIDEAMSTMSGQSLEYLKDNWPKPGFWDTVRTNIAGLSVSDLNEMQRRTINAIRQTDGHYENDGTIIDSNPQAEEPYISAMVSGTASALATIQESYEVSKNTLRDIVILLSDVDENVQDDIVPALKEIPKIASHAYLDFMHRNLENKTSIINAGDGIMDDLIKAGNTPEDTFLRGGVAGQKTFVTALGLGGLGAMDFLNDQEFNLLPELAKALNISVPLATGLIGGAFAAGSTIKMIKEGNKRDVANYFDARKQIVDYYRMSADRYMEAYEEYTKKVEEALEKKLISLYDLNRGSGTELNLYRLAKNIRKEIHDESKYIRELQLLPVANAVEQAQ